MKLTEEQKKLVENNIGLVYFVVDNYYLSSFCYIEREDLLQEGLLSLCNCIGYFNSEKGNISTFIVKCVKKHLSQYVQNFHKKKFITTELDDINIKYYDEYDFNIDEGLKQFLYKYLPERIASMTIDHYINNKEWEQIAREYGYKDRKNCCAIVQQNLKRLGKYEYVKDKYIDTFL